MLTNDACVHTHKYEHSYTDKGGKQKRKECPFPSLVSMKGALLMVALLHDCGTDVYA